MRSPIIALSLALAASAGMAQTHEPDSGPFGPWRRATQIVARGQGEMQMFVNRWQARLVPTGFRDMAENGKIDGPKQRQARRPSLDG